MKPKSLTIKMLFKEKAFKMYKKNVDIKEEVQKKIRLTQFPLAGLLSGPAVKT